MKLNVIKNLNINKYYVLIALTVVLFLLAKNIATTKISPHASLGFSVLVEEQSKNVLSEAKMTELLTGEKIKGSFKAGEDNLGIVLIRFVSTNKNNKSPSDSVIFRIKEINEDRWYYEHAYKVDQFQPHQYFTFGFPKISVSRNKMFIFEIESTAGKKDEATALSPKMPQVALAYQFSKSELLKEKGLLLRFVLGKISYALGNMDLLRIILLFPLSLLVFIFIRIVWGYKSYFPILLQLLTDAVFFLAFFFLKVITAFYFIVRITLTRSTSTFKYINFSLEDYAKKHQKLLIFLSIGILFLISILFRVSFYIEPKNFEDFFFSQLGGSGDYDELLKNTIMYLNRTISPYWSLMDDWFINMRLFALFFNLFGFVKGLNYFEYFLIFLSSLVTLVPFVLLSRLKKFSLGGLIASLFLAINPLFIWLSTGRPLDILTSFLFSLFIIFFVLSLEKKNYLFTVLLGLIGFLDGLNHELMILNDLPALLLFAFYHLFNTRKPIKTFPYLRLTKDTLFYAFIPVMIFIPLYLWWDNYYYYHAIRDGKQVIWSFGPKGLFAYFNPITDPQKVLGINNKFLTYFFQLNLTFTTFIKYTSFTIVSFLTLLIPVILKNSKKRKKYFLSVLFSTMYVGVLYFIYGALKEKQIVFPISETALRYFLDLTKEQFLLLVLFVNLFIAQIILLRKYFINYILTILVYILVLGYGLYTHLYDRHFSPLIIVFFILLGATVDNLASGFSFKKKNLTNLSFLIFIIFSFLFIGKSVFHSFLNVFADIDNKNKQVSYLSYVGNFLPKGAVILVNVKGGQNPIWVSENTKRTMLFNSSNQHAGLIEYGKLKKAEYPYTSVADFSYQKAINDRDEFKRNNFYILDYDIEGWNKILTNKESGHPLFFSHVGAFKIERVNKNEPDKRPIYKLLLKNN